MSGKLNWHDESCGGLEPSDAGSPLHLHPQNHEQPNSPSNFVPSENAHEMLTVPSCQFVHLTSYATTPLLTSEAPPHHQFRAFSNAEGPHLSTAVEAAAAGNGLQQVASMESQSSQCSQT